MNKSKLLFLAARKKIVMRVGAILSLLVVGGSMTFAQSTFDTLLFLHQYNQTNCYGKNGHWDGMSCSGSSSQHSERLATDTEELESIEIPNLEVDPNLSAKLKGFGAEQE